MVLQNYESMCPELTGIGKMEHLPEDIPGAQFDITLVVKERGDGSMQCTWNYDAGLFDHDTVKRMSESFSAMLDTLTSEHEHSADVKCSVLAKVSARDEALISSVNDTAVAFPDAVPLNELVEDWVLSAPDHVALIESDTGRKMTYSELNAAAERVASHICKGGKDVIISVLASRSIEYIVALSLLSLRPVAPTARSTLSFPLIAFYSCSTTHCRHVFW